MKLTRKLIPIAVVFLFLGIAIAPSISAGEQEYILTIWMPGVTQDDYFTQIQVSLEDLQIFIDNLGAILDVINTTMSFDSPGGTAITYEEWQQIGISVNDFTNSIRALDVNFPNVDTKQLVSDIIDAFFNPLAGFLPPEPVISIGSGFTWIPFYGYESFFGMMLRPMFTRYFLGFSKIGGLISTYTKFGTYSMITIGFTGLFINFGDVGFDRILGPTIYIGKALVVRT